MLADSYIIMMIPAYCIGILVFIVLGRLFQLLQNLEKPPYIAGNEKDSKRVSVFIYRLRRGGSGYSEYKFVRVNGKWKFVIEKEEIRLTAILMIVFMGILIISGATFIEAFGICFLTALFGGVLYAVHRIEAHRILMKKLKINGR